MRYQLFFILFLFSCASGWYANGQERNVAPKHVQFDKLNEIGRVTVYSIELNFGKSIADTLITPPPVTPTPKPEPQPQPKPEPAPEPMPDPKPAPKDKDDFFDDDDDFFDDDISYEDAVKKLEEDYRNTIAEWEEEYAQWAKILRKKHAKYLRKADEYLRISPSVESLSSSVNISNISSNLQSKPTQLKGIADHFNALDAGDFHIVNGGFEIPIRDQNPRGTCAAFTGVRAIEIALWQKQLYVDLSEQFFYYLSKPECKPCTQAGSHFINGIKESNQREIPIIQEKYCPYIFKKDDENVTHHPLPGCQARGTGAAVSAIDTTKITSPWGILGQLHQDRPVMIGVKLPDTFMQGSSLMTLKDAKSDGKGNEHSAGHAMLIVGYIRLPESMEANEGRYCAIVANSWSDDYGVNGYTCLTEKWLHHFRIGEYWHTIKDVELIPL